MMGSYGGWDMGAGGWLWMLGGLALVIGVVALIVWAMTNRRGAEDAGRRTEETPLDILRERYARGDITAEEFEQAKRILGY